MTTLIAVYRSDGTCIGRCDAKCYDAKHDSCQCVCGGRNHGAGVNKAVENTEELFQEWIDDYTANAPDDIRDQLEFDVLPKPAQLKLAL